MASLRNMSAFGASFALHAIVAVALLLVRYSLNDGPPEIAIESIVSEDRVQDEFTRDLEVETEVAETFNTVAGGVVSTAIGSAAQGPIVSRTKIETSETLKDPEIKVNVGDITMPGDSLIGVDLGEGQVSGEVGAFVEGYGAALGQITQELIRLMREQKVMVVWLFDESESMKDDQREIREKFHEVYEELGIVTKKDKDLKKRGDDVLLTAVVGYGKEVHPLTAKPTADVQEIRAAIDKVAIDESGLENMCLALSSCLNEYRTQAARQKRKLVLIVVTDESGDDGEKLEPTLDLAVKANAPIYFLSREAIFGYPYARIRWKDPKYGLTHWLRIRRGPETPYREALQWDGLHARSDEAFSSGFGSYEQVRLAKQTGGVFFVLPSEEENLSGVGADLQRRFDALDMKEYEPLLVSRRDYEQQVLQSKFRTTISKLIDDLDPHKDKQLNLRVWHYPLDPVKFREQAAQEVIKAQRAMTGLNQVIPALESIKPLRDREESQRWRANYDLIIAQAYAYRIRLFQYLLAMDEHANTAPRPSDPKSNEWNVRRIGKSTEPNDAQYERLKKAFSLKTTREEYLQELKEHEQKARELFQHVIAQHPRTPWAQRAQHELNIGFGVNFQQGYRDPNYDRPDIKVPNL